MKDLERQAWERRAAFDVGRWIAEYLKDSPAPAESRLADDLHEWSAALMELGLRRLPDV